MARITKVTTANGDAGMTRLGTGQRINKGDAIIRALGSTDELNSQIGLLRCYVQFGQELEHLGAVQLVLFDVGGVLAMSGEYAPPSTLEGVAQLTGWTQNLNAELPELQEFVVPGGSIATSHAHVCRTVCRRAESDVWLAVASLEQDLAEQPATNLKAAGTYLNRLSDYFFVLARYLGKEVKEQQWQGPATTP